MFNRDSGLVKIWVNLLKSDDNSYTKESIPPLSNLREVVLESIEEGK